MRREGGEGTQYHGIITSKVLIFIPHLVQRVISAEISPKYLGQVALVH